MDLERYTDEVRMLSNELRPLLAGKNPAVLSAALADCAATYIAGHWVPGDSAATEKLRREALEALVQLVRDLVPACAREIGTWEGPPAS